MIENYYNEQVNWANAHGMAPACISRKSPQQILDSMSKSERQKDIEFKSHNIQPSFLAVCARERSLMR
jgi:hypothetical protein